jgi:hypothetical protein
LLAELAPLVEATPPLFVPTPPMARCLKAVEFLGSPLNSAKEIDGKVGAVHRSAFPLG